MNLSGKTRNQNKNKHRRIIKLRIKKSLLVFAAVITVTMFSSSIVYAKTISNSVNATYTIEKSIFYVSSAEEFKNAYKDSEDGDTIYVNDGSTIELSEEFAINKSIAIKAVTNNHGAIKFTGAAGAKLKLLCDNISITGLNFTNVNNSEMIVVNSPEGAEIKDNSFTGSGNGTGILVSCTSNDIQQPASKVNIAGNTFDNLDDGIKVTSGKGTIIEKNSFTAIGSGQDLNGAVLIDTDSDTSHIGSVEVKENTVDTSTLCGWLNSKIGSSGNISDAGWFDSHVTFAANKTSGKLLSAANPLLLTLLTGDTINNVTAGSIQDISFRAAKVSQYVALDNVKFEILWTTTNGNLSSMAMTYNGTAANKISNGLYDIPALDGVNGDYTLKVTLNRKGAYGVTIYAVQP